jgi:hypothetical protein
MKILSLKITQQGLNYILYYNQNYTEVIFLLRARTNIFQPKMLPLSHREVFRCMPYSSYPFIMNIYTYETCRC